MAAIDYARELQAAAQAETQARRQLEAAGSDPQTVSTARDYMLARKRLAAAVAAVERRQEQDPAPVLPVDQAPPA